VQSVFLSSYFFLSSRRYADKTGCPAVHRYKQNPLRGPAKSLSPVAKVAERHPHVAKEVGVPDDYFATPYRSGHTLAVDHLKVINGLQFNVTLLQTAKDGGGRRMLGGTRQTCSQNKELCFVMTSDYYDGYNRGRILTFEVQTYPWPCDFHAYQPLLGL
jgi:hypothetical protein